MEGTVMVRNMLICLPMCTVITHTVIGFNLQILMNAQRTVMAVSKNAQTLMVPLSAPVEMGSVLAVMGGAVMVS